MNKPSVASIILTVAASDCGALMGAPIHNRQVHAAA
jgi:hypothetical protein